MGKKTGLETGDNAPVSRALAGSLLVFGLLGMAVGGWYVTSAYFQSAPGADRVDVGPLNPRHDPIAAVSRLPLTDITAEAGIDFVHNTGAAGDKLLPETMGSGAAWLDYDNDGDQDLLLVNSREWPWTAVTPTATTQSTASPPENGSTCRLYANDGTGRFSDVSKESGMDQHLYGMGVAIGDYDNDGWCDVFLSAVGPDRLLRNERGTFRDVTETAGVAGAADAWGTSCGFVDYDNDGLLDLIVCNYVEWSKELDLAQSFTIDGQTRAYGPPIAFGGTFPYLYHNEGEGEFRDVSEQAGLHVRHRVTDEPLAKGLGLMPLDVNTDGYMDFIIANDTVKNLLFINQQDGTFHETAEMSGIAYDRSGNARGAMGIDAAAFQDDGSLAIAIGNFTNEPVALYLAAGPGQARFNDIAMATGIGPQTRLALTFGLFFSDLDLDGRLDVVAANGHLERDINRFHSSQFYAQPPQVFWNSGREGNGQLIPLGADLTSDEFAEPLVGRGAAYADIDADGDQDFVITANGSPARLVRNDQRTGNHWLRFRLVGRDANRSAIGADVVVTSGEERWIRTVMPTRSYLSQCELPVTFGLGDRTAVDSVAVRWPGGKTQAVTIEGVDREIEVVEQ